MQDTIDILPPHFFLYSDEGYLKVWLPDVSNTNSLELLRDTIKDEEKLRRQFNEIYSKISQD